jgi:hypothetical protein
VTHIPLNQRLSSSHIFWVGWHSSNTLHLGVMRLEFGSESAVLIALSISRWMLGNTSTQVTNASSNIHPSIIIILHLVRHLILSYDIAFLNSGLTEPVSQCYNTNYDDDDVHYRIILHKILSMVIIKGLEKCNMAVIQNKNTQWNTNMHSSECSKRSTVPFGKLKWGSTSNALRWHLFKMCLFTTVMLSQRYLHSLHRNSALEFLADFWKTNNSIILPYHLHIWQAVSHCALQLKENVHFDTTCMLS